MDSLSSTEDLTVDVKISQDNLLLEIIKELCGQSDKLSSKLKGKVSRIVADCDLTYHTSLHKICTADESTSTVLGLMHQTTTELTFDEQTELNQAIIQEIQTRIPTLTNELQALKQNTTNRKTAQQACIKDLQDSLDAKFGTLQEQENEKVELMMEWLNHKLQEVTKFSDNSSELFTLKTRVLDLKSKILHLQILQNIFTETNQSIKAYTEVHRDLKDSIKEMEEQIRNFKEVIDSDKQG